MAERRLKRPRDPIQLGKLIVDIATGEVEVHVERLSVLNTAPVLPFQLDDDGVDETLRLHHRYLDLRRDSMRHNVHVRFALTQAIRRYLE